MHKWLYSSEKLHQTLWIVWCIESIVPGISFNIMVWKYVDSFSLWYLNKRSVFLSRLKKFCLIVPYVLEKCWSVQKILLDIELSKYWGNLTDSKIIVTELKSFTATWSWLIISSYVSKFLVRIRIWSWVKFSHCVSIP